MKKNSREIIQTKAVIKFIGLKKNMKPTSPKMIFKSPFPHSSFFAHLYPSLIKIPTKTFPWNKTNKTPTFTGIPPYVTILTMLEAIRTPQDRVADEESGNIVVELRNRGKFGGLS